MKRNISKGWLTLPCLVLVMAFGTFANGGVVVGNGPKADTCKEGVVVGNSPISAVIDFINGLLISDSKDEGASCGEDSKNGMLLSD